MKGKLFPEINVPFRDISPADTNLPDGQTEKNEPVRVYDTSGVWGDDNMNCNVEEGLPAIRLKWINNRNDVDEVEGRELKPEDNGYTTPVHEEWARKKDDGLLKSFPGIETQNSSRKAGNECNTNALCAQGIITPEMEYIAIRENLGREKAMQMGLQNRFMQNKINWQHKGMSWGANLPEYITPEFVRNEVAKGRAIIPANINHPEIRTDDYRTKFSCQDKC